ncbi:MAG TPA: helix-turn-helix domain-containing protein [Acidimicrobiia bacterium]|nr:helix-turn-helix domain-containing protein [Acidimicrobiia bacterium]
MSTGRARKFDPETEVELLCNATLTVLRRNDYDDVTIADILEEAGLSTRSFYRHFQSKDELLLTLHRRDAEAATARLRARVRRAATPPLALEAWIDEILSFRFDRRKAERVALLGAPGAKRADGYAQEALRASRMLSAPLDELLEAGRRDGSFPAVEPRRDAEIIRAIVWDAAGLNTGGRGAVPRAAVRHDILHFCLRALGAEAAPAAPAPSAK